MSKDLRIKDMKVYNALRDVANNLKSIADAKLPKYPNLEVAAFFATTKDCEKKAEIVVHGVNAEELGGLIELCNTYRFFKDTMFGKGIGHRLCVDKLLPYITLCDDNEYTNRFRGQIAKFN